MLHDRKFVILFIILYKCSTIYIYFLITTQKIILKSLIIDNAKINIILYKKLMKKILMKILTYYY